MCVDMKLIVRPKVIVKVEKNSPRNKRKKWLLVLKGEVEEEVVEKVEAKKEEFGNVLGGRKPKGGRYGRQFTERLLSPP